MRAMTTSLGKASKEFHKAQLDGGHGRRCAVTRREQGKFGYRHEKISRGAAELINRGVARLNDLLMKSRK